MPKMIVGVCGASGVVLARVAIQALLDAGFDVEVILSKAALLTAGYELGPWARTCQGFLQDIHSDRQKLHIHKIGDVGACVASGSYKTDGMLIIPCSMNTLACIALGIADNLLKRSADVILKERRKLVIVPRETPLNEIHLEHMLRLSKMGAVIVPPVPSWYIDPQSLQDIEKFIVGRVLDVLGIEHKLYIGWRSQKDEEIGQS